MQWQLDLDFTPLSYLRFGSLLFAHHADNIGFAVGASTRDSGRKEVGPKIDPCAESDQSTSPLLSDRIIAPNSKYYHVWTLHRVTRTRAQTRNDYVIAQCTIDLTGPL